jgi:hypothetical protein
MSCYFRHLKETFKEAGIVPNSENKKLIDAKIHQLVGVPYKHCPDTWKKVKIWQADEKSRQRLVQILKDSGQNKI